MKKFLLMLLALPSFSYSMEILENLQNPQEQQQQALHNDEQTTNFLIYVRNPHVVPTYESIREKHSSIDAWLRKELEKNNIDNCHEFTHKFKYFLPFVETMESGKQQFPGAYEYIDAHCIGDMYKVTLESPVDPKTFKKHFYQSGFVYRIKDGRKEHRIDANIALVQSKHTLIHALNSNLNAESPLGGLLGRLRKMKEESERNTPHQKEDTQAPAERTRPDESSSSDSSSSSSDDDSDNDEKSKD